MKILNALLMISSSSLEHSPGVLQDDEVVIWIYFRYAKNTYNGSLLMDIGTNKMHMSADGT
jgi:hypothetical protein